jgi:hypothetical protein
MIPIPVEQHLQHSKKLTKLMDTRALKQAISLNGIHQNLRFLKNNKMKVVKCNLMLKRNMSPLSTSKIEKAEIIHLMEGYISPEFKFLDLNMGNQ